MRLRTILPEYLKNKKRCQDIWYEGYDSGHQNGYDEGYDEGYDGGKKEAEEDFIQQGRNEMEDELFGTLRNSVGETFDTLLDRVSDVIGNSPYFRDIFLERVKERFGK